MVLIGVNNNRVRARIGRANLMVVRAWEAGEP
jgi:hypothetical protein